jgi:alpha-tubulin suppressor-like RCC1 family protein
MNRLLRAASACAVLLLGACGSHDSIGPPTPIPSPTLTLRDTTLLTDETAVIGLTAVDAKGNPIQNASIAWQSSAPLVVSVDGAGRLGALGLGTSVVTASYSGVTAHATITVKPHFTQIATGEIHTCGISGRGDIYCWGTAFYGEMGPLAGDCTDRFGPGARCSAVPVRSVGLRAASIVAGAMHTCALDDGGVAFCWGANFYGEGGTGSSANGIAAPTAVAGGLHFKQIVAGRMHTCGITTSDDAYCWGWDQDGQLGAGDVSSERCRFFDNDPCSRTPRLVVGGHKWTELAATDRATCGITTAGELFCWGLDVGGSDGMYCQLEGNNEGCIRTPRLIASARPYRHVSIGGTHRCEQAMDGTLDCWGANYLGAFGNGTEAASALPVTAAGGAAYASFAATRTGTCALAADGRAQCWGPGEYGAVGNGSWAKALSPVDVAGGHHFTALASSGSSDWVCGIAEQGRAYCWGFGLFGQLGGGLFDSQPQPVPVPRPGA